MEIYQWLVPLIAIFYIARGYILYKRRKRLIQSTLFWFIFWVGAIALAIVPNEISFKIADLLGFKDNVNAIIFVLLGFLFMFVNWLTYVVEKLERQMTDLVRRLAMNSEEQITIIKTHEEDSAKEQELVKK